MKAEELFVCALVRVNQDGLCIKKGTIVEVRGVDADDRLAKKGLVGSAHCRPLDDDQFEGGIWCEFLDPIPLTSEILEKNGFKKGQYGYCWKEKLCGYMGQSTDATTPIEITYEDGHCVVLNPHIGRMFQGSIFYVHELQRASRLCNIYKEIVL